MEYINESKLNVSYLNIRLIEIAINIKHDRWQWYRIATGQEETWDINQEGLVHPGGCEDWQEVTEWAGHHTQWDYHLQSRTWNTEVRVPDWGDRARRPWGVHGKFWFQEKIKMLLSDEYLYGTWAKRFAFFEDRGISSCEKYRRLVDKERWTQAKIWTAASIPVEGVWHIVSNYLLLNAR